MATKKAELGENPFQIEEGVIHDGGRGGNGLLVQQLYEQVKKLPVDKKVSVLIPITIADQKNKAQNLFLGVKRIMADDKLMKNFTISIKIFTDAKGEYVNARIWRLS